MSYRPQKGIFFSDIIEYFDSIIPDMEKDGKKHNYVYHRLTHKIIPLLCKMGLVERLRTTPVILVVVNDGGLKGE